MDWNDLRFFLALARTGSVRSAGQQLGVSHTTVARRAEALEEALGTRLFDRHRDGYALTADGRRLLPAAERAEEHLCALQREAAGRDARLEGVVHVTCCDDYVAGFVLHDLRPLCDAHPGLHLSVTTDSRPFNLARGEADLAIRALPVGADPPEHLVSRRLAPLLCAEFGPRLPGHAADRWLSVDDPRTTELLVGGSSRPELPTWGGFGSLTLLARAAAEGFGLAILPTYVGDADPRLARLSPGTRHLADLWLLYHPDLRDNARLQAVRDTVRAGFAAREGLFLGRG